MTNNSESERIFEAILASAFRDAAIADMEEAMQCEPIKLSPKRLKEERRAYNRYKFRCKCNELTKDPILLKAAAVVLVVCCVGFAALVSMPEVRATVVDAIVWFCDRYISLDFAEYEKKFTNGEYTFGYIPKGFALIDEYEDPLIKSYTFKNDSGDKFSISYSISSMTIVESDNENSNYSEITINGINAYLFRNVAKGEVKLIFNDGDNVFKIYGHLQEKDAVKIAEKISK